MKTATWVLGAAVLLDGRNASADESPVPPRPPLLAGAVGFKHAFLPRSISHDAVTLGIELRPLRRLSFALTGAWFAPFDGAPSGGLASRTLATAGFDVKVFVAGGHDRLLELYLVGGNGSIFTKPVSLRDPEVRKFDWQHRISFSYGVGGRWNLGPRLAVFAETRATTFLDQRENAAVSTERRDDRMTFRGEAARQHGRRAARALGLSHAMKLRPLFSSLLIACALLHAQRAGAAEPEAVRLEVDAPRECVDEAAVREEVATLGGRFRDANLDDRARTFRVEIFQATGRVRGRLVVRDLVFRENVREVNASDCTEATQSVALFIATALDEAPPPLILAPAPITPAPALWPEPATAAENDSERERRGRVGSGGVGFTGFAGKAVEEEIAGFRAFAAMLVGRTTRLGVTAAVSHGILDSKYRFGISKRAGFLIAWGAPWNDCVVGFAGELGAAWGDYRDFDALLERTRPRGFLSIYAAARIVFQVPFKSPVRPIAAFGNAFVPNGPDGVLLGGLLGVTAETGIVWQAW